MSGPEEARKPEAGDGLFGERLAAIKKSWGWLGIGLSVLSLGVGGYIQQLLQPYFNVLQIIWATLPLTVAVAIVAFMALKGISLSGPVLFAIIIGTFLASVVTGVSSGTRVAEYLFHAKYQCFSSNPHYPQVCTQSGYAQPKGNLELSILSGYVHVYGVVGFLRALLVGAFLAFSVDVLSSDRRAKARSGAGQAATGEDGEGG